MIRIPAKYRPDPINRVINVTFGAKSGDVVTWGEIQDYLAISSNDLQAHITNVLLPAAIQTVEDARNVSLNTRQVTAILDNSKGNILLPYGPVVSIVSMHDEEGDVITDYELRGDLSNTSFPVLVGPRNTYLKVVYSAGFGATPPLYKLEVLREIAYLLENKGDEGRDGYPARIL